MDAGVDTATVLTLLLQQRQRRLGCASVGGGVQVQRRGGRVFECRTCGRRFPTFQALGGHRASHRRPRPYDAAAAALRRTAATTLEAQDAAGRRVHGCPVCGVEFAVGQALGGHMRRHRAAADALWPGPPGEATDAKDADKVGAQCAGGICLDLNLAPSEKCAKCRKNAALGDTVQGVQKTLELDCYL